MIFKRLAATGISYLCLVGMFTSINANASYYMYTIDNDPPSGSPYSYYPTNLNYMTAYGSYNNDMEISGYLSSGSNCKARYAFPYITPISLNGSSLQVYLNDYRFTDPYASYELYLNGNCVKTVTIDQYAAPAGWGTVYTAAGVVNHNTGWVTAVASNTSNKQFGSDAIQVKLYY